MKILYVYDEMPKVYQTYMQNLLDGIRKKIKIESYSYQKSLRADIYIQTYGFKDNVQRVLYKLGLTKYKSSDIKLFCKYDIIHLQHSYLFNKVKILKNLKNSPKIIITLRGGDTYVKPWIDEKWSDFYKNSEFVDYFIVMSKHQANYLLKWGVPIEKINVIPVSFGNKEIDYPKKRINKKLKLVSAFRMTWEKNISDTLYFAKKIKEKGINFTYDIYGGGSDLGHLYYLVDKLQLNGCIKIIGVVDNNILKDNLENYTFFIQLSISESLGVTLLEAQSKGIPCIVSNSGGLPEAVRNKHTGLVNNEEDLDILVDRTIDLWMDTQKYKEYSNNAIENVNNNFSIENEINSLTELYKKLIKNQF